MTLKKKELSFWQIWNMSFGFLGIQFGFALQGGFMSRIFQTPGADKDAIPFLWISDPLTGLLIQPIVGYLSDRTWHPKFGRRKPFFFYRSSSQHNSIILRTLLFRSLDGSRFPLDSGCLGQHQHGAISCFGC